MVTIFYNENNLNDSMVINFKNKQADKIETYDNFSLLFNQNELIAINIYQIKKDLTLKSGYIFPTNEVIKFIFKKTKIDISSYIEKNFVIGFVLDCIKIENTHLSKCKVKVDNEQIIDIVCGASNIRGGLKVVVAKENTIMPDGFEIKKSKLKGFDSNGMICSFKELNIENNTNQIGIIELNESYVEGEIYKPVFSNL